MSRDPKEEDLELQVPPSPAGIVNPETRWTDRPYITDWEGFDRLVRSRGWRLLRRLDDFPESVLVTGCQRSGTTSLSRLITRSEGVTNFWFGPDDELDGALILSGYVDHTPRGRYCFQTTYVNRCRQEYGDHRGGHKVVWILRNPLAVVASMLNNWKDASLARLFEDVGVGALDSADRVRHRLLGAHGLSRLRRACSAYRGKTVQLFDLRDRLGPSSLMVIDYDDLVLRPDLVLRAVFEFVSLPYRREYAGRLHARSLRRSDQLGRRRARVIKSVCEPTYEQARILRFQP